MINDTGATYRLHTCPTTYRLPSARGEKVTALLVDTTPPESTVVVVAARPGIGWGEPVVHDSTLAPAAHPASSVTSYAVTRYLHSAHARVTRDGTPALRW